MSVSMLSEQLVKAGVAAIVFTTTANGEGELPVLPGTTVNIDGVPVTYFSRITKDHTHFSPALLRQLWRVSRDFDVIHIHAWWNLVSIFSCSIALLRKIPVVLSPRGTLSGYSFQNKNSRFKNSIHNILGKSLLKKCYIHATSKNECLALSHLIRPNGFFTIANFIRLDKKIITPNTKHVYLKLIFLSRIDEKKGLDILLEALKLITVPYQLTIAGDGNKDYINQLKLLALKNKIDKKIDWVGFQNENKFELLGRHDLLVLPSYDENFGNVVIESLSVGTAVLISENVGLADYVEENNLGWICRTDAASVSDAINSINNHKDELERIRENAPSKILADFDPDELVKKYIAMYYQIIGE